MPDTEKVISDIKRCIYRLPDGCRDCSHYGRDEEDLVGCMDELLAEALELLKEQEATTFKPHYIDKYDKHIICGVECGACHKEISSTYHYCPYCGRSVKWE